MTIIQQLYSFRHIRTIDVPRILQWRGFTYWGPGQEAWGIEVPSGVQGQSPVGDLGTNSSETEAKCEISVHFSRFNEYMSRAWTVYIANTQFKEILKI